MSSVHLFSHIAIEHKKTFSLSTARTQSALCIHAWTETSSALCSIRFALVGCRHVFAQKYHDLEFVYNRSCRFFSASLIKFYSTRLTRQAKVTMMDMKDSDELESKIIWSLALCTVTRSFFSFRRCNCTIHLRHHQSESHFGEEGNVPEAHWIRSMNFILLLSLISF